VCLQVAIFIYFAKSRAESDLIRLLSALFPLVPRCSVCSALVPRCSALYAGGMARSSWENYQRNPKTKKKKDALTKKLSATKKAKKYRAALNKKRKELGVAGKGGKDVSHTKSGKMVLEDKSTNRARNRGKKPG